MRDRSSISPQERYDRLADAARWFPLDRNVRTAPEIFRAEFNKLVNDRMKQ
jgi:hypothetical protein